MTIERGAISVAMGMQYLHINISKIRVNPSSLSNINLANNMQFTINMFMQIYNIII